MRHKLTALSIAGTIAAGTFSVTAIAAPEPAAEPSSSIAPSDEFFRNAARSFQDASNASALSSPTDAAIAASAAANTGEVSAAQARRFIEAQSPSLTAADAIVPAGRQVSEILGERALRMQDADGRPAGVLTSNLPLAKRASDDAGWKLVDLDWIADGDRYRVADPVISSSLPSRSDGLAVAGPIGVHLAPAASAARGVVAGQSVTYPNVAPDTDMLVRSTPVGFAVAWNLRSPAALKRISTPFEIPQGASLSVDESGAVTVRDRSDSVLGVVSATTARDALNRPVRLKTTVEGNTVRYDVEHAAGSVAYPVNVDPNYGIDWGSGTKEMSAWAFQASPRSAAEMAQVFGQANPNNSQNKSLGVYGLNNAASRTGDAGAWYHFPPGNPEVGSPLLGRNVSNEHATWFRFDVDSVGFAYDPRQTYHFTNYFRPNFGFLDRSGFGITDSRWQQRLGNGPDSNVYGPEQSGFISDLPNTTNGYGARLYIGGSATQRPAKPAPGSAQDRSDNTIAFSLVNRSDNNGLDKPFTALTVGFFRAWATDYVPPRIGSVSPTPSSQWTDAPPSSVSLSASDNGTGVRRLSVRKESGETISSVSQTCPALGRILCPFTTPNGQPVPLSLSTVPEGRNDYSLVVEDGDAESTRSPYTLLVDRTGPEINLSGSMTVSNDRPFLAGTPRELTVSAKDGSTSSKSLQRSGVKSIVVLMDGEIIGGIETPADQRADNASLTQTVSFVNTTDDGGASQTPSDDQTPDAAESEDPATAPNEDEASATPDVATPVQVTPRDHTISVLATDWLEHTTETSFDIHANGFVPRD